MPELSMEPLNDLDPDNLVEELADEDNSLREDQEKLTKTFNPSRRRTMLESLFTSALTAGYLATGLRKSPEEVRRYWRECVRFAKDYFHFEPEPGYGTPIELLHAVYLALILGDLEGARDLARSRSFQPEAYDDGEFIAEAVVMGYVAAVLAYAAGERRRAMEPLEANIERFGADKRKVARDFVTLSRALRAILKKDAKGASVEVDAVLKAHATTAKRGRLRDEAEGLVSLHGLAFAAIAQQEGVLVSVESPYLPLDLLAAER